MADTTTLGESTRTVDGTESVRLATTGANWKALLSSIFGTLGREKLTANRTYYVRTDGSDSNTGLVNTAGGAFLTIQHAYDVIAASLDLAGYTVTVQIGDGTYTGALNLTVPWTGGGAVTVQGNTGALSNVIISTVADCIAVNAPLPGVLTATYVKLTSSANNCLNHNSSGPIRFSHINFGSASANHIKQGAPGGDVRPIGGYTISGGASAHAFSFAGSVFWDTYSTFSEGPYTVTITGTPAFSTAFIDCEALGSVYADTTVTWSGAATGGRYSVIANGVANSGGSGATFFPGDVPGSTASGGQYL